MGRYRLAVGCGLLCAAVVAAQGVSCAFGVGASPPVLYAEGNSTQINANTTPGHTVLFSVSSGAGYVDPGSSVAQSDGFAHTAYFSGPDAGTSTIRTQDQQTGEVAYCTVKVFKITQSPEQIFWFPGGR